MLPLTDELSARIEQRAAGNPLFAVTLLQDWVCRGALRETPAGYELADDSAVGLPSSLMRTCSSTWISLFNPSNVRAVGVW